MKANQKFLKSNKAEIGIGTMIVFIASVLVAAVAAAVIVDTSGQLQDKSKLSGEQSVRRVASNIEVARIMGERPDTATATLNRLHLHLSLAPGASRVDLKSLIFQWDTDAAGLLNVAWSSDNTGADGGYMVSYDEVGAAFAPCIRDTDGSVTDPAAGGAALTPGDICVVTLPVNALGTALIDESLSPRKQVALTIVPEVGSPIHADFIAPESYGADLMVSIRQ